MILFTDMRLNRIFVVKFNKTINLSHNNGVIGNLRGKHCIFNSSFVIRGIYDHKIQCR